MLMALDPLFQFLAKMKLTTDEIKGQGALDDEHTRGVVCS
jgi:hypothetical protein